MPSSTLQVLNNLQTLGIKTHCLLTVLSPLLRVHSKTTPLEREAEKSMKKLDFEG